MNLVVTLSDKSVEEYTRHTIPIIQRFAKQWGAEFLCLDNPDPFFKRKGFWNYRTRVFYELLSLYDRIIYMDSDIVINKTCPNLFHQVPADTVGLVFEDKGSRKPNRMERIQEVIRTLGPNPNWKEGYLNAGFYVVSSIHKDIFTPINGEWWGGIGYDCNHYCYQIFKQGHKYVDLGYRYNHMCMFSEPWNGSKSRFDSYLIHYAGQANFPDKGNRSRTQLMVDDIAKIYGEVECR